MLYLNKQRFVQNIDFSSLNGRPCKNTFVDGCLQFYLTQKDFSVNKRPNGACKNTSAPLCFFAQNLSCVTVLDAKFHLRVQVFDTKKTICTRFSGHCKNSFAPSFRINSYLKIYFWIDVCNAFSGNRTGKRNVNFTATADLRLRRLQQVYPQRPLQWRMSFQQRENGNKLTMACSLFTFWRDQRKFLPFSVQIFSKTPFSKTAHLI